MKLRNKVLTTSLAATLVLGSVAGLPLSSKGLAEAIGTGKAYASSTPSDILDPVYLQLTPEEKTAIGNARTKLGTLTVNDVDLSVITNKDTIKNSSISNPLLVDLIKGLSDLVYSQDYISLVNFINDNRSLLVYLKQLSGVTENITYLDAVSFFSALQTGLGTSLADKTPAEATTIFKDVLASVISQDLKISKVIQGLGLTADDLATAFKNVSHFADPNDDALKALIAAYGRLHPAQTTTTNNSGGGGGGISTGDVPPLDVSKATETLNSVSLKLAELLNDGKGNGLAKAIEAIENAIRKAATVDLSKTVEVEGQVAKPTLDAAKLEDVFKSVKEIGKLGNEKLLAAAADAKPAKVIVTLDLGAIDAKTTQIPLSNDLIAKAKENGIDALAIKVNGISLAVDVDQLSKDTNVTVQKEEKTAATSITNLAVASEVYEFTFESNGKKIESFTKPVEVRIPLPSTPGVDSELLVLTKLDDGKLIFKGGKYNAETKEFVAFNKSFSTYAVIENKVSFNDIASVNEWAGRQIAVTAAKGIVEGRSEGKFVPGDQVTRAEFAKLIVKAFGLEDATATESFSDVNDSDWFKPYVAAAVKAGLIQGRSDDKFEPNATITRAELATIASRALTKVRDYKATVHTDAALKTFADAADIHSSLKDGVALATDLGVVIGEEGGKFNPNNGSTRAQAAVVIYRLLNK